MEDSSNAAIYMNGHANMTVSSSRISGNNFGVRVSSYVYRQQSVIIEDTEMHGNSYAISVYDVHTLIIDNNIMRPSGRAIYASRCDIVQVRFLDFFSS